MVHNRKLRQNIRNFIILLEFTKPLHSIHTRLIEYDYSKFVRQSKTNSLLGGIKE